MSYVHDVDGVEQETVEIRVRLGRAGFDALRFGAVQCKEVWITEQPDGTFALGVVTADPPAAVGLQARKVEHDDRRERFPGTGAIDMRHLLP